MKLHSLFLFTTSIFIASKTYSNVTYNFTPNENCNTERLDKKEPGNRIKVTDQDGLFMCGAHATSYLVDHERLSINPNAKPPSSPLFLGLQFAKLRNLSDASAEDPIDIALNIKNFEFCDANVIKDHFSGQTSGEFITALYDAYSKKDRQSLNQCLLRAGFSQTQVNYIKEIGNYLSLPTFSTFSSNVLNDLCKDAKFTVPELKPIKFQIASHSNTPIQKTQEKFRDVINANLRSNKPTAINYCGLVRTDPSINGVNSKGRLDSSCKRDGVSLGHSSVVVGRRLLRYRDGNQIKQICQYLVRDSFGSSCAKYPDDPTAEPSIRCENGQVWIDEDALFSNVAEIFHF